ncbi:MAG: metallophosphoesterase [Eubacteriales bacterium]|nr:metallophosphoesterase [Eubacteriales bacterium]
MKNRFLSLLLVFGMVFAPVLFTAGSAAKAEVPEAFPALWEAGETRDKIVVISDIHLGIDDRYGETLENLPLLVGFLKRLQSTEDVRELVIAGDFLDEWYLPVYYPRYTDQRQFYKDIIANNQDVIGELNNVIDSGIRLVYVIGNHDITLEAGILQEAIPGIVQANDAKGLGAYYTGDREEIVIEHGHRYDVFSAPDTVTNAELCGNDETILPAGYFFARYAATWVLEDYPVVEKNLPVVTKVPEKTDLDQYGAYLYYSILKTVTSHMTPKESLDEKIFDMRVSGFDDAYSFLDFYPAQQEDGTISAPVLFRNIQRTWGERQAINQVKVPNSFIEAVLGTLDWRYFSGQAMTQYLSNTDESVDVVVFGHTHVPVYQDMGGGKYYLNDGTWIDNNKDHPDATRIFAVITTGEKVKARLYRMMEEGSVSDVSEHYSITNDGNAAAGEPPAVKSVGQRGLY